MSGTTGHDSGDTSMALRHDARWRGRPLVMMFDVDGTLAPIVASPELARVPNETRAVLRSLAEIEGVTVALVSGRPADEARALVGVEGVWAIGNHGAEVIDPSGALAVEPAVSAHASAVASAKTALDGALASLAGVLVEDKRWTLSVHFRSADPAVVPHVRAAVEHAARLAGLRATEGKKVLELRPPVDVDKGTAVLQLAARLGARAPEAAVVFSGDDVTDEDAFRVLRTRLPRALTIHIGGSPHTAAEYTLASPEALREILEQQLPTLAGAR